MTTPIVAPGIAPMAASVAPTEPTALQRVVVGGVLRGLTLALPARLTLLLDADGDVSGVRASAWVLRLLAGVARPSAGTVHALGGDPARSPDLRRSIALLGDDVLLHGATPLDRAAAELARVRGVDALSTPGAVRAAIAAAGSLAAGRRAIADRLAAPERARLLLVSHPGRHGDVAEVRRHVADALARGAQVVVATTQLDDWLHLAHEPDAVAALLVGGALVATGPAHGLPWSIPVDGSTVRLVRVVLDDPPRAADAPATSPPAHRLAAELFADPELASRIAAVETVGRAELRVHTRDPRRLAQSIAARAADGLPVRRLLVHGATASALVQALAARPQ